MNSRWIKNLNIKSETMKLLEDKTEENFITLGVGESLPRYQIPGPLIIVYYIIYYEPALFQTYAKFQHD